MGGITYHHDEIYEPIKDTVVQEYEYYKKLNDFIAKPPKKEA